MLKKLEEKLIYGYSEKKFIITKYNDFTKIIYNYRKALGGKNDYHRYYERGINS